VRQLDAGIAGIGEACEAMQGSIAQCHDSVKSLQGDVDDDTSRRRISTAAAALAASLATLEKVRANALLLSRDLDSLVSARVGGGVSSPGGSEGDDDESLLCPEARTLSVTEITEYLHERGIDFGDCLDTASLRRRYRLVAMGKYVDPEKQKLRDEFERKRAGEGLPREPLMPTRVLQDDPAASGGSAVVPDPHPGTSRVVVDRNRYIYEVKVDACKAHGADPDTIEVVCNGVVLEDHRRILDYPDMSQYRVELRKKKKTS